MGLCLCVLSMHVLRGSVEICTAGRGARPARVSLTVLCKCAVNACIVNCLGHGHRKSDGAWFEEMRSARLSDLGCSKEHSLGADIGRL